MAQYIRETVADGGAVIEIYRNDSGATITRGYPVSLSASTADGVGITNAIGNLLHVGTAYEDIIDGAYGRVQVAGYANYAVVDTVAGGVVTSTDALIGGVSGYYKGSSPVDAVALESVASSGSGHKIWLGPAC